jgi:subtilisin-like proprotein convertase family protein
MSSISTFLKLSCVVGAAASVAMPASAQTTLGCTLGGPGASFPTSGTGDGTYSSVLPTYPGVSTLNVATIPAGATCVTSVTIRGASHTYAGDLSFVLDDPSGARHNIFARQGAGCDLVGDYTFVDVGGLSAFTCTGTSITPGTYNINFGGYVSGNNGITNDTLGTIPAATGNWTLSVYDWAAIDIGSMTGWEICFGTPPPPPPPPPSSVCVAPIGGGGTFPTSGTGDGTWPGTMPSAPLAIPLAVAVPAGATKIVDVKLNGLTHTWLGDIQITLKDPSGTEHNIVHRPGSAGGSLGNNCDLAGDYRVFETFGADFAGGCGPGDYFQYVGSWPNGTNGILNTALGAIPITSGVWTLTFYDWAGGDTGYLTSWELCFDTPSGPTAYCTAGTSTNGCVPAISASAQPSATLAHPCSISIANVEGQKFGIVFYGINNTGFNPTPWANGSNSFLCVKGPTQRTGTSNSGGTINACDGALNLNWNAYQTANPGSVGNPFSVGNHVYVQGWYRDPPAPKTTNLTNALDMTVTP